MEDKTQIETQDKFSFIFFSLVVSSQFHVFELTRQLPR